MSKLRYLVMVCFFAGMVGSCVGMNKSGDIEKLQKGPDGLYNSQVVLEELAKCIRDQDCLIERLLKQVAQLKEKKEKLVKLKEAKPLDEFIAKKYSLMNDNMGTLMALFGIKGFNDYLKAKTSFDEINIEKLMMLFSALEKKTTDVKDKLKALKTGRKILVPAVKKIRRELISSKLIS